MEGKEIDFAKQYPSSKLLQSICFEEYKRVSEIYDKIYEKVHIALAFSGVILLVILSGFDYTIITKLCEVTSRELFSLLTIFICSIVSTISIVWAVIQLLSIMHSNAISMLDCVTIRNEKLYQENEEVVSMWLIDKYTKMIPRIKKRINKKQEKYDSAISKIVIAMVCYAVSLIVQKGV